jgi:hypothetical protein
LQNRAGAPTDPNAANRVWQRRKVLWQQIYTGLMRAIRVTPLPMPDNRRAPPRSWLSHTGEDIPLVVSGYPTPPGERSLAKERVEWVINRVRGAFPQLVPGLLPVSADPRTLLESAWCPGFQRAFPHPPEVPPWLATGLDLGRLLVDGPLSFFVRRSDEGRYQVDLSGLGAYRHHPGTRSLATVTELSLDAATRKLSPESIRDGAGTVFRPGDAGWGEAQRVVTCGIFTRHTVVGHLGHGHLFTAGSFATATRNALDAGHPLKALLWPHVFGTLDVNNLLAPMLIGEHPGTAVVGDAFNIEHKELWRVLGDAAKAFDLRLQDPREDRRARGCDDGALAEPTVDDAVVLWDLMLDYTREYLEASWASDEEAAADAQLLRFLAALDALVPNGIRTVVADLRRPARADLARLLAIHIWTSSVWHRVVGTLGWNFQSWPLYMPSQVYDAGGLPPADVYQRFFNALMATNGGSRPLLSDFGHIAVDGRRRAITARFQSRLRDRQAQMVRDGADRWGRIFPADLNAVIAV